MLIGVTDTMGSEHKFQQYVSWLQHGGLPVRCLTLSYTVDNLSRIGDCDALVLTGGHDVEPSLYHGPEHHQKIIDVDPLRDKFDMGVLERALRIEIPILGICRGLQIANVYFGGTLVPDIEEAGYRSHRSPATEEYTHTISIEKESVLGTLSQVQNGIVNSSHHQAVDTVGKGLRVVARSDDGIIEAMELDENRAQQFFLLVQWHPERMSEFENPFSKGILDRFFSSVQGMQGVQQDVRGNTR